MRKERRSGDYLPLPSFLTNNPMKEEQKEKMKERGYSILDFILGAFGLALFLLIVVVSYSGLWNVTTWIFPSLKKDKTPKSNDKST